MRFGAASLYHEDMYDPAVPVGSLWEETAEPFEGGAPFEGPQSSDTAIIGGGYTGLSAAYHLAKDYGVDVCLLEAGPLGWGASGRNGGFCAPYPSSLGLETLLSRYGAEEARRFMKTQEEAIDLVRALAKDEAFDIEAQGEGVWHIAHDARRFAGLQKEADLLREAFGQKAEVAGREEVAERVYDSTEQFGGMWWGTGFGLHPMRFARGLGRAAARAGARLHGQSKVLSWAKREGWHELETAGGILRAKNVIVATNGFTRETFDRRFAGRVLPIISNIIATRPLTAAERAAQNWLTEDPCTNTRRLLFYYRLLPDGRFIFGGRGDMSGTAEDGARMKAFLSRRLGEVFPAWAEVPVTHFWRGLVCMTRDQTPAIGRLKDDPSVFYGLGYHGDGVAAAPWTGRFLARLLTGAASENDLPAPMRGPLSPFPLPGLRRWYLRGALVYYFMTDI